MDGNGRWAEGRGLPRAEGHRAGVEAIRAIVKACPEKKVSILSVFAFGQENWARPKKEVNFLMDLFIQSIDQEIAELHAEGVCLKFIGARDGLSDILQSLMQSAESLTANNQTLQLNIIMNYSGRWDMLEATRKLAKRVAAGTLQADAIDEAVFADALATRGLPEPDMLIRTSGEQRISNFFLWQLAYSELYFTPVPWPDFTPDEFEKALAWFSMRERRYGKTSQQMAETDCA